MNQDFNNLNQDSLNTQGSNGIPSNQSLNNTYQQPQQLNPNLSQQPQQLNTNLSQPSMNHANTQINNNSFNQPQQPIQQPVQNNANINIQPTNNKPKKKLGLIIGIVILILFIVFGIVFGSKLFSNNSNDGKNNSDNDNSNVQPDNNSSTKSDVEIIYFDVVAGKKCNESDYNVSNSKNGYNGIINKDADNVISSPTNEQTSCLRFFTLSETNDTKSLLLDHSTSAYCYWNTIDSTNGPGLKSSGELKELSNIFNDKNEVLYNLKEDTSNWSGTENPNNYSYASYEINYNGFKARLPQLEEIIDAGEISVWVKENEQGFFGGEITTKLSKYWWLYDNLEGCEYYGCRNEDKSARYDNGYWTANSLGSSHALEVSYAGCINKRSSKYTNAVRPVIEVLKSKLN